MQNNSKTIKGNFSDNRLDDLYQILIDDIRSFCLKNNIHYPCAVGVLEFVKNELINEDD